METTGRPPPHPERPPPRRLDRVRDEVQRLGYSSRTERAYLAWIRQYILYHRKRHPDTTGDVEITGFLTCLATRRKVAALAQNQALSALQFLYRGILGRGIGWLGDVERPPRSRDNDDLRPPRPDRLLPHPKSPGRNHLKATQERPYHED